MFNLLKKLSRSHEITLLSFIRHEDEKRWASKLDFCRNIKFIYRGHAWQFRYMLKTALSSQPFLYVTYDNERMRQAIRQELSGQSYDLIHLEPSYVWPSLPKTDIPVVVTEHNIESTVYLGFAKRFKIPFIRPLLYWDVHKLKNWEQRVWKNATEVITVSAADREVVSQIKDKTKVHVIPNGVDLGTYTYKERSISKKPILLFVGYFGWLQNRDALSYLVDLLWPSIIKQYPECVLRVVGNKLPAQLVRKVAGINGVYVPEVANIVAEYHNADLLLAPIRVGGGSRYKILEAMATGLPVVTTTVGASGLPVLHQNELLVADSVTDTGKAIGVILSNTKVRLQMTKQARKLVEEKYSWDIIAKQLEFVWQSAG